MSTIIIEGVEINDSVKSWVKRFNDDLVDFMNAHEYEGGSYVDGMIAGFCAGIITIVKEAVKDTDPAVIKRLINRVKAMLVRTYYEVSEIGEEIK